MKGCQENSNPELLKQFSVLKKYQGKLDCLIREMLFIRERKPKLKTQLDSIRAKVFVKMTSKRRVISLIFVIKFKMELLNR